MSLSETGILLQQMGELLDHAWYQARYPDIATAKLDPVEHFIRFGAAEKRDPNRFFDSTWYIDHYPDVAASGMAPLTHYLRAGARELRNPHPRFDAAWYVEQHPAAAANPLLYHLRVGTKAGYQTEPPIDIRDYLPSQSRPLPVPRGVFADAVIPLHHGGEAAIRAVLADRAFPLARIIVVDDRSPDVDLIAWLRQLADDGAIHLIRNRRHLGFAASAKIGIEAAETHDVALLHSTVRVPVGWLQRLAAHAYAGPRIATVSPFSDSAWAEATAPDEMCRTLNAGRGADIPVPNEHCMYIRRAALLAAGDADFRQRAKPSGWRHRQACDLFIETKVQQPAFDGPVNAPRFVVTAALFSQSELPVILMVTHNLGGGIRQHIDSLTERYRPAARIALLEATARGAALSLLSPLACPVVTLPADRLDDLVVILRSLKVSRVHIHHLVQMDINIRALIHRLGVPFDVTVHDYFAICPQINLLIWSEGLYCGEPGPAICNTCIADRSSHGARDIVSWRRDRAWQFIDADRVICPSNDVKERLDRYGMAERALVVPHEQQTEPVWKTQLPPFTAPPLRIALLGVLANHKGARSVAEVAETAASGTIQLHLIGYVEDTFPKPAAKLIKITGKYQDKDLPGLLQKLDPHVIWLPHSWPETYSYTLSAAIESGLPIVATNLGSAKERLAGRPYTWLVDHRAAARDWLAAFDDVAKALSAPQIQPPVSRPVAISNFYPDEYLSPKPVRTRHARKPRIAVVPERYATGALTPCAYIRLIQPIDHPSISDAFDIVLADTETIGDYEADIIVTQRYAIPDVETADRLADHARRTGATLLFDLDDDLLSIPSSHPDAATLRPLAKGVRRMLTLADAVWVSTPGLAERLAQIRPDSTLIENRLDERIWSHGPAPNPSWDDPIRVLCMGTTTHDRDFAFIEPVLLRLKAEYGARIVIDVLGMTNRIELPPELNRIGPSTHASRSYPGFVNWLTTTQPRWHIGLAPLLDTPFNRSKSPIKAMDYAAMGLTVLASDAPAYRGSIADGPAGQLVANDAAHWHAALDWLIRDQNLRQSRIVQARQAFLDRATLASHAEFRLAAWQRLLPGRLHAAAAEPTMRHGSPGTATRTRRHRSRGR